jgi:hypothetical protein
MGMTWTWTESDTASLLLDHDRHGITVFDTIPLVQRRFGQTLRDERIAEGVQDFLFRLQAFVAAVCAEPDRSLRDLHVALSVLA